MVNLDHLVAENFVLFLLEKWRISSGEHFNEPYSFKNHPFLLEIAKDNFPFKVTKKCAQGGYSELAIARAIWRVLSFQGNILYTFPAGEQMQQFVDARVRNAIITNEFIYKAVTGTINLKKIEIRRRQIYFRGAQKRRQVISIDVSTLLADEIDEYEEGVIYTLNKRLGAALNPYREYFSTPSFHGTGVSLYYHGSEAVHERGSDQRVWSIKCDHCSKWNEDLIWPDNVTDANEADSKSLYYQPNVSIICRHCKKPLNVLSPNAQWVIKNKANSDYCHGYHISKLMIPTSNLNQMWLDSFDPAKEQEFYNSDLGEPYEPKGSRLTDAVLYSCRGNHLLRVKEQEDWCYAGIDIGHKIHCTVFTIDKDSKKPKIISLQEVDSWEDLEQVYRDFNILCSVIDANPDKEQAIEFQRKHDGVWLAYYMQYMEKTPDQINVKYDDSVVHIHRTLMMEIVLSMFNERKVLIPMDVTRSKDFIEHMKSPVKAQKQDLKGDWIPFFPKTRTPDHFFHATLYAIVAYKLKPGPGKFSIRRIL